MAAAAATAVDAATGTGSRRAVVRSERFMEWQRELSRSVSAVRKLGHTSALLTTERQSWDEDNVKMQRHELSEEREGEGEEAGADFQAGADVTTATQRQKGKKTQHQGQRSDAKTPRKDEEGGEKKNSLTTINESAAEGEGNGGRLRRCKQQVNQASAARRPAAQVPSQHELPQPVARRRQRRVPRSFTPPKEDIERGLRSFTRNRGVETVPATTKAVPINSSKGATKRSKRVAQRLANEEPAPPPLKLPKLHLVLTRKEIQEDWLKITGHKYTGKPRKSTKTLMFVHISPDVESFGETLSTLKFAERVASVELGAARSNKECAEIANLKDQVSQLKDGITKKDAEVARKEFEIANLQMIIERLEKGENNENKSRLKPTISSKLHRRKNNEDQKSRKMTNENGNANVETRQPTPKIAGGKKASTSIGLKTGHVPENLAEHFGSPSACSPSDSPSENRIQVEDCQQLKIENERHSAGAKTFDAGTGRFNLCPMQSGLRIGAPSNVQSNEEPTCGGFETILLENIGGRIVAQDDPFLLKNVLDEGFGDDEAFDCRGACEADSASLYSDSCFSTDVDNSGSSHMEQDKKVGSSSFRPLHNRKYMIKNEASTTPDTSTFKVSPPRGGCKSKGGLSRRHKPAGQACTSDTRTSAKRNALPTGNPNQEVEQASSRRSATSAALLTTWR